VQPKACLHDSMKDSDSCDRLVTVFWCQRGSLGVSSLLVNIVSGLYASSRFGDTSCESPPPNRPVNILIFQVPKEILIYCKGGGLTNTSTLIVSTTSVGENSYLSLCRERR
jgi:hypothetical protein